MFKGRHAGFLVAGSMLVLVACGDDDGGSSGVAANALSQCAVDKHEALATFTAGFFAEGAGPADLGRVRADLLAAWRRAVDAAAVHGLSCDAEFALTVEQAIVMIDTAAAALSEIAGDGPNGTDCAGRFFEASGVMMADSFRAEGRYLVEQGSDSAANARADRREVARRAFLDRSDRALADGCVNGSPAEVRSASNRARMRIDRLVDDLSFAIVAAGNLSQQSYVTLSPTGSVAYEGREFTPICMGGTPYHFFARRGTVNKLVVYYQGGGACWEKLTCSVPVCDTNVDPEGSDNPNRATSGFADRNNPNNPFRNWHTVFVSYCGCDIHFGDSVQDYVSGPNDNEPLRVQHRGFHNAKVVEKWAREHFIAPEEVFVTGSSAGAYGAWFHAPLLHDVWPRARFHVLADAGNGVITPEFLEEYFPNWNFAANLPDDIPDIQRVLDEGSGIPGYTEVVAREFPDTNWAHYTTAYDGGSGGQTGFYNVMLNDNNPINGLTWWNGSCQFADVMREQAQQTYAAVPRNYRYYIGTGSRHTIWGSNKVYGIEDPSAPPAERKITEDVVVADWVSAMLASTPREKHPEWTNFDCGGDCGLVLPGDPLPPSPLPPPFELDEETGDVFIQCAE